MKATAQCWPLIRTNLQLTWPGWAIGLQQKRRPLNKEQLFQTVLKFQLQQRQHFAILMLLQPQLSLVQSSLCNFGERRGVSGRMEGFREQTCFSRFCLFASRPADLLAVFAAVCCFSLVSCGSLDSFYLLAMAALTVSTVEAIAVVFTC